MSDDLREDFEKAFEEHEVEAEEESGSLLEETTPEEAQDTGAEEVTAEVDETPAESQPESKPEAQQDPKEAEPQSSEAKPDQPLATEKPPASWSPQNRESWGDIPKGVQEQIMKREREVEKTLHQSSGARKAMSEFAKTIEPYRSSLMASNITNPMDAVGGMLQTDHALRHGSATDKAETIVALMKNYNVDVQTLDQALSGAQAPQQPGPNNDVKSYLDQRLQPLDQMMSQQRAAEVYQNQQVQMEARRSVGEFGQNKEFFADVRGQMADIIEMKAARGQACSYDEAYNMACNLNPEIKSVMDNRAKEQQIMETNTRTAGKRNAAVSIMGHKSGEINKSREDLSARELMSQLWDESMGGGI